MWPAYKKPDVLFPELFEKRNRVSMRVYVGQRLSQMASEGTLYLTDVVNQGKDRRQREFIRSLAGDVILGYRITPEGVQAQGVPIPRELAQFRVRIVAAPHMQQVPTGEFTDEGTPKYKIVRKRSPIAFSAGFEVIGESMDYETAKIMSEPAATGLEFYKSRVIETGELDVELSVPEAWWCLKKQGAYFKSASGNRLKSWAWKCMEIRPGTEPPSWLLGEKRGKQRARQLETQA